MKSVIYLLKEWEMGEMDIMGFTYNEEDAQKWVTKGIARTYEEVEEIGE